MSRDDPSIGLINIGVLNDIEHVRDILRRYRAPYYGMVIVDGAARKNILVFTTTQAVERIAAGEHKKVIGMCNAGLEYFGFRRGYEKTVSLESKLQFIGEE